jgi:hypothetical protein
MTAREGEGPALAEVGPSGDAQVLARLDRYARAKVRARAQASYLDSVLDANDPRRSRYVRLIRCGSWLVFRHWLSYDRHTLAAARFCSQHLLCPLCAIRRGAQALKAYHDKYLALRAQGMAPPGYLVTVTVKDGPDLLERVAHLRDAWRALWHRKRKAEKYPRSFLVAAGVTGGVASYEVKRGQGSGLWHPHLHAVLTCDREPDGQALSDEWRELTGDSYIVDVRPVDEGDPAGAFSEVCKYALKFADMDPADTWLAFRLLRGDRLRECYGAFRGVEIPDSMLDPPLDGPWIDRLWRFLPASGGYYLESIGSGSSGGPFASQGAPDGDAGVPAM